MKVRHSVQSIVLVALLAGFSSLQAQVTIATVGTDIEPIQVVNNASTNQVYVLDRCGLSDVCGDDTIGTVTVINSSTFATQRVVAAVGTVAMAINTTTNKVYVANSCGNDPTCESPGTVTVIDGNTLGTQSVTVGINPEAIGVDSVRNKIYVGGRDDAITVIDGATLSTQSVPDSHGPYLIAVNSSTNQIFVSNGDSTATVFDGATLTSHTVSAAPNPNFIAVNSVTNKAYISSYCLTELPCSAGGVTVVDGNAFSSQVVSAGFATQAVAVNNVTNKIYVVNQCGDDNQCQTNGTMTIIDGSTLGTQNVPLPFHPFTVGVNPVTNKIYASGESYCQNCLQGYFYVIDAVTLSMFPVAVGSGSDAMAVDSTANRIYVANWAVSNTSVVSGDGKLQFVSVNPCRLLDTRQTHNPILGGTSQDFTIPQLGGCNIPTAAVVYSFNVTVVPQGSLGYLTVWPTGQYQTVSSTLNSLDGRIKANAALVMTGEDQKISIYASNTTDVVLDIDGYFEPSNAQTDEFYSIAPCRVVDTRGANGNLGGPYLSGSTQRNFPVVESPCIPQGQGITAYSFNFTAVPHTAGSGLGYLTVWPEGGAKPVVSTLNNPTGTIVANAAIVPAGIGGGISVYPDEDTDLVIDINGYFAPSGQNGLSLYPEIPCRVLDTRNNNGPPFVGQLTVSVSTGSCPIPSPTVERAYIFNATVVPSAGLGYLTLWPNGQGRPLVSTLNALDGFITSNMAIVSTTNGSIDAYADELTQLILDLSGFFAP